MATPSYGTDTHFVVEEYMLSAGTVKHAWVVMDRFERADDAFECLRILMGMRALDTPRTIRVMDRRRNLLVLWPAADWTMGQLDEMSIAGLDDMLGSVDHVFREVRARQLRGGHTQGSIWNI